MSKKTQKWAVPLIAVVLGMLLGAILMLCFGYNPLWGITTYFILHLVLLKILVKSSVLWVRLS